MTKKTLQAIVSEITPYTGWLNRYIENVPLFIEEASQGFKWDKNSEVFRQYLFESNHCAGSIGQGDFEQKELSDLEANWGRISPLLTRIAENQIHPNFSLYYELAKIIRENTRNNKMAATRRMIAALQPELLSTIYSNSKFYTLYNFIRKNVEKGDSLRTDGGWFEKSHNLLKFFEQEIDISSLDFPGLKANNLSPALLKKMMLMTLPWQLFELINNPQPISETLQKDNPMIAKITDILVNHKPQIILQGPPGTGKTYTAKDVAKYLIFDEISDKKEQKEKLEKSDQFELIQFHPSYSYEDFVQKIAVNIDEQNKQPRYDVEASILMKFANKALQNYQDYQEYQISPQNINDKNLTKEQFSLFREELKEEWAEKGKVSLEKSICHITGFSDNAFIIEGENSKMYIPFNDIVLTYLSSLNSPVSRESIQQDTALSGSGRRFSSYVIRIVDMFEKSKFSKQQIATSKKVELKKYVLVIDEINRANLATVLGELIYGLEYRGESIKPLYGKKEENNDQLILPPNLYIIGTMNTADRSVGSIDYAIRRRFAFYNVLPKVIESDNTEFDFDIDTFEKVSSLFIKNDVNILGEYLGQKLERSDDLSEEFNPEDVWIGHSYFIYKTDENRQYKIIYEIIPLIKEYIKDGILKESAYKVVSKLLPQGN